MAKSFKISLVTIAFLTAISSSALAATATANLDVSAVVVNNCSITTAALAFGTYDPIVANAAVDLDATGTVTVTCTQGATTTIGLGLGVNASGTQRRMNDGGTGYLEYDLYQDAGRTTSWGDAAPDLLTPAPAPSSAPRPFTVYGRVSAGQDVPAGSYNDTVVATVNF
ncbi:MAG: spore coat protein U domain-containing protein [Deltaproteobacteria bacterium]|nr:spore coat protein U domain-containing protein [Deltaproteobacteria bacterium]